MNSQFAPAYSALASLYSTPETLDRAIAAGRKAVELEPGNLTYRINCAYVLLNSGKTADARALAARIETSRQKASGKERCG
jgi:Flp pilus assembly protein TadD